MNSNLTSVTGFGGITVTLSNVGPQGPPGPAGTSIPSAPTLTPVLTTDLVAVVRNGVVYLATVSDVMAAGSAPSLNAGLNFSHATNSQYIGVL